MVNLKNMIFIDGSHDYENVVFDILNYSKMLLTGGYLIMDDSSLYLDNSYGKFKGHPDVIRKYIEYKYKFLILNNTI